MPTKNKGKSSRSRKTARPGRTSLPKAYVSSIAVIVSDRKKATEWYTGRLGLDLLESVEHWVAVGRKGKGGLLHLCQMSEFEANAALEPGNSGITLRVPGTDFVAACTALQKNGVEFIEGPKKEPWGWYATVRDPDGNELFLMPDL